MPKKPPFDVQILAQGQNVPVGVAVDGAHVYWTNREGTLFRVVKYGATRGALSEIDDAHVDLSQSERQLAQAPSKVTANPEREAHEAGREDEGSSGSLDEPLGDASTGLGSARGGQLWRQEALGHRRRARFSVHKVLGFGALRSMLSHGARSASRAAAPVDDERLVAAKQGTGLGFEILEEA